MKQSANIQKSQIVNSSESILPRNTISVSRTMFTWSKNLMEQFSTICSLTLTFIGSVISNLDFSVISRHQRLCFLQALCHMRILFNICTVFVLSWSEVCIANLEYPSLKVIYDFRWSSIKIVIVSQTFCLILFSRFLHNHPSDRYETLHTHRQSSWACLIENNFDLEQWPWPGGYYLTLSYFGTYLSNRSAKYHQTLTQNSSYSWLSVEDIKYECW